MFGRLSETVDLNRLPPQGLRVAGALALEHFGRLVEVCRTREGQVSADLLFEHTARGLRVVHGIVDTSLPLICQRCLEPMMQPVHAEVMLALFLAGESQEGVPEDVEALVVDPLYSVTNLLEDEILLAMPMMPRHPMGTCVAAGSAPARGGQGETKTERPHPFATLEKLRRRD
jgi:uncharacterized protein